MAHIDLLITDYLNYLEIEKNRSPKTRENYERYLKKFVTMTGVKSPQDITDAVVRNFRITLARHSANEDGREIKKITQSYYVIALRNFLKYLAKRDVKALAAEKIELPKISRRDIEVVEYADLERILSAPPQNTLRGLRDRAILETLFSTGLRVSELCALDRSINLDRGEISVRGKGDKLRVGFLSDRSKKTIRAYLEKRSDAETALFISMEKNGRV